MKESQIIAQEMANAQRGNPTGKPADETEIYNILIADFPPEAMQPDKSRGFALTSVKAQFVTERLNEAFGFMNWSHGGEYEVKDDGVLFHGALIFTVNGKQQRQFGTGYAAFGPKKLIGDVYKSAKTDSLSKSASQIGVGNSVFKGLIDASSLGKTATPAATARTRKKKATATTATKSKADPTSFETRRKKKATASATEGL